MHLDFVGSNHLKIIWGSFVAVTATILCGHAVVALRLLCLAWCCFSSLGGPGRQNILLSHVLTTIETSGSGGCLAMLCDIALTCGRN